MPPRRHPPLVVALVGVLGPAAMAACLDRQAEGGDDPAARPPARVVGAGVDAPEGESAADVVAAAGCGDIVLLEAGEHRGPIRAPSGVTVRGPGLAGGDLVLSGPIEAQPGDCGPARVEDARLVVGVGGGVVARDGAAIEVERVRVRVEVPLDRSLVGTPAHGALFQDAEAFLRDVEVQGAVPWGVVAIGGQVSASALTVSGATNCRHVECALEQQVIGVLALEGAALRGADWQVLDTRGLGLAAAGGGEIEAERVRLAGAASQCLAVFEGSAATLDGFDMSGCGGAGVLANKPSRLRLANGSVAESEPLSFPCDLACTCEASSGVSIALGRVPVEIANVDIALHPGGNPTSYGLGLFGGEGAHEQVELVDVAVTGPGALSLAVSGGMERPPRWEVLSELEEAFHRRDLLRDGDGQPQLCPVPTATPPPGDGGLVFETGKMRPPGR